MEVSSVLRRWENILLQIGLLLVILLLLPTLSPHIERTFSVASLHGDDSSAPIGTGEALRYAVVFDAGSTGSRVHVFKFREAPSGLKLISDTFEQLKPGLSSFADDPAAAAQSLKPLMDIALKTVPKNLQASTSVSLKATAGLRLLPGDKADKILAEVTSFLALHSFSLAEGAVAILGGQDEGGFAWLTLNYLLGKLGGKPEDAVAAIDLGGGSVQEAFAVSDAEAAAAPKGYTMKLKGGGKEYNVYVHSYLGYGLMAGRSKVIETFKAKEGHPCFVTGFSGSYKYAGKDYAIDAAALEFGACSAVGVESLDLKAVCGVAQEQCSFNGAWRGNAPATGPRTYYVSSYFWDRAVDSGIITDPKAISWGTTAEEFSTKAKLACDAKLVSIASVVAAFPGVNADAAPYLCLDLTYCQALLLHGFRLDPSMKLTLVKQVEYDGQSIEAAWPLGAAINDLS